MNVAFLTSAEIPHLTADDRLAAALLEARGVRVEPLIWSDDAVDPTGFDMVIVRSTWDWYRAPKRFGSRLEAIASRTRLENARAWDWLDKRYLLARLPGVRIPTTHVIAAASEIEDKLAQCSSKTVVIKPATAAAGYRTARVDARDIAAARAAVDDILRDDVALLQPYFAEIESDGEWSLLFFGGRYSHAIKKRPRRGEFRVHEEHGGTIERTDPPDHVLEDATRALAASKQAPLYARVDGIVIPSLGGFCVTELELVEPELFLRMDPNAPERFAAAIMGA
jgi:glutathione synthase/RimK-type ligase-like ATP-grasp enzyme